MVDPTVVLQRARRAVHTASMRGTPHPAAGAVDALVAGAQMCNPLRHDDRGSARWAQHAIAAARLLA